VSELTVTRDPEGEPLSVRLHGKEFTCEDETGETTVPKDLLVGIKLSEIPDDIIFKPVESIEGNVIHIQNNIGLSTFSHGSATALVEEFFRRKYWDGDIGLSPYIAALRKSIAEREEVSETDFQDDDDYIFLHYQIQLTEDMEIQDAIKIVEGIIGDIETRADELAHRRRDGLTGLFDRGSFDADLEHALTNPNQVASLVLVDIDHFKVVNDTYGHQAGDAVLRAVAQVLTDRSAQNASPYRYGGEELAAIVSGGNADASLFAESVRTDIQNLVFEQPARKITVSLGVASAPNDGRSSEELVQKADTRLYRAKHEGRNRVVAKED
jgi:diguanylate cyclase (GGDEF)-like protein